jgi:hypothetical protein
MDGNNEMFFLRFLKATPKNNPFLVKNISLVEKLIPHPTVSPKEHLGPKDIPVLN